MARQEQQEEEKDKEEDAAEEGSDTEAGGGEDVVWLKSKAREFLRQLIVAGTIPVELKPKQVWLNYLKGKKEFAPYEKDPYDSKWFASKLRYLQKKTGRTLELVERDQKAFDADRKIYPRPTQNHRGEPFWPDSNTFKFLKKQIDEEKHLIMEPKEMYAEMRDKTDCAEENIPLDVYRKHIYQEIKSRKFEAFCKDERYKKYNTTNE